MSLEYESVQRWLERLRAKSAAGFSIKELEIQFLEEIWKRLKETKTCFYCNYKYKKDEIFRVLQGEPDHHMLKHKEWMRNFPRPKKDSLAWFLAGFKWFEKSSPQIGG